MTLLRLQGTPCTRLWGDLAATDRAGVRSCDECQRLVYRAENVAALKGYVAAGQCVSVPAPLARNIKITTPGPCVITHDGNSPVAASPTTTYALPTFMGRMDMVKKPETPSEARKRNEREDRESEQ